MIAPAGPGSRVAGAQERVDLGLGEVGDQFGLGAFGWDRENASDRVGVFGVLQREVGEQRVDRREPVVAGPRLVAAAGLEVLEERHDQRRVELADVQRARWGAGLVGHERQQQLEGVTVGGDCVRAGAALSDQAVGEVPPASLGRAGSWPRSEPLVEPVGGQAHQLRGSGQIPVGVRRRLVAKVGRRATAIRSSTGMPACWASSQGAHSKAVAEIVRARARGLGPQAERRRDLADRLG